MGGSAVARLVWGLYDNFTDAYHNVACIRTLHVKYTLAALPYGIMIHTLV